MEKLTIGTIPAIIWGKPADKVYIHVHGKMSRKEYAEDFARIAERKGYQTVSFDLPEHGERTDHSYRCDVFNGIKDLTAVADYVFSKWNDVSLFACSIGAYFSLNTYAERQFTKCLFQSPMVSLEYFIRQQFAEYTITEDQLRTEKVIATHDDPLRWDYYQYVISHPVTSWNIPTSILYGAKDNLQPIEIIRKFADTFHCKLTVSQNSEHPFMNPADASVVSAWLKENISADS
jgi:pimeloyl-ACP methyl ester carboxylesterase